jgi:hypothetical protein
MPVYFQSREPAPTTTNNKTIYTTRPATVPIAATPTPKPPTQQPIWSTFMMPPSQTPVPPSGPTTPPAPAPAPPAPAPAPAPPNAPTTSPTPKPPPAAPSVQTTSLAPTTQPSSVQTTLTQPPIFERIVDAFRPKASVEILQPLPEEIGPPMSTSLAIVSPHEPPQHSSTELVAFQAGSQESLLTSVYNDVSTRITDVRNRVIKNIEEDNKRLDEARKKSGGWPIVLTPEGEALYEWFANTKAKKQRVAFEEEYKKLLESTSQKHLMDSPFQDTSQDISQDTSQNIKE